MEYVSKKNLRFRNNPVYMSMLVPFKIDHLNILSNSPLNLSSLNTYWNIMGYSLKLSLLELPQEENK